MSASQAARVTAVAVIGQTQSSKRAWPYWRAWLGRNELKDDAFRTVIVSLCSQQSGERHPRLRFGLI
jgi:hypothetical protein